MSQYIKLASFYTIGAFLGALVFALLLTPTDFAGGLNAALVGLVFGGPWYLGGLVGGCFFLAISRRGSK